MPVPDYGYPDYGYEEPFGDPTEDDLLYLIAAERRRTHSVKRGNRTEKVPKRPDLIATYEAKLAQLTGAA
jgi:hypothetical protein